LRYWIEEIELLININYKMNDIYVDMRSI